MPCDKCGKRLKWKRDHLCHYEALRLSKQNKELFNGREASRNTMVDVANCCGFNYYKNWELHFIR